MTNSHDYTAMIFEMKAGYFMGIISEVPGAASFAKTEEELIERLKDAIVCISEANKANFNLTWKENPVIPTASLMSPPRQVAVPCA